MNSHNAGNTTNRLMIMDTTLRDGEQTSGVAFTDSEKLSIARILLEDVNVDRIEIASARVSEGEYLGASRVWPGQRKKVILSGWKFWDLWTETFH